MLKSLLFALSFAVFMVCGPAVPAEATARADAGTQYVTVVPVGFSVAGSGWRIEKAIAGWNNAQNYVQFNLRTQASGETMYLHLYNAADGYGAYTYGGHIYLNEHYHPQSSWNTDYGTCLYAATVAHELGHTVGIPDIAGPQNLMYGGARSAPRDRCEKPAADDVTWMSWVRP